MPTLRTPLRDHLSRLLRPGGRLFGLLIRSRLVQFLAIGGLIFALEELKFFSREFRIVGVYPAQPFRLTFSGNGD